MLRRFVFGALTLAIGITAAVVYSREGLTNVFHNPTDEEKQISTMEIITTPDDVNEMGKALIEVARKQITDFRRTPLSSLIKDIDTVELSTLTKSLTDNDNRTTLDIGEKITTESFQDIVFLYQQEEGTGATLIETLDVNSWILMSFVTTKRFPASIESLQAEYDRLIKDRPSLEKAVAKAVEMQKIINIHRPSPDDEMIFMDNGKKKDPSSFAFNNDELRTLRSYVGAYLILLDIAENGLKHQAQTEKVKQGLRVINKQQAATRENWTLAYAPVYNQRHGDLVTKRYKQKMWKDHWETPAFFALVLLGLLTFWQTIAPRLDVIVMDTLTSKTSSGPEQIRKTMRFIYKKHPRYLFWQPNKKSLQLIVDLVTEGVALRSMLDDVANEAEQIWEDIGGHPEHELHTLYKKATTAKKLSVRASFLDQLIDEWNAAVNRASGTSRRGRSKNGSKPERQKIDRTASIARLLRNTNRSGNNSVKAALGRLSDLEVVRLELTVVPAVKRADEELLEKLTDRADLKLLLSESSELIKACKKNNPKDIKEILDPAPAKALVAPEQKEALPRVLAGKKIVAVCNEPSNEWKEAIANNFHELGATNCEFADSNDKPALSKKLGHSDANTTICFIFTEHVGHDAQFIANSSSVPRYRISSTNASRVQRDVVEALSKK